MSFLDSIRSALEALRANVLRSILTALGIIIGVGAVIAMVAVGSGAEQQVQSTIQRLGSNILIVLNGSRTASGVRTGSGTQTSLTEDDAMALQSELDSVAVAAGTVRGGGQLIHGNSNWYTSIYGVTLEYFEARNWVVARGRNMTPSEARSAAKVALVGDTVVTELFGGQDPVGQIIRIRRVPFRVIGVLGEKGQTPFGRDQDDVVFLPLSTAKKRILGGRQVRGNLVGSITIKAASAEHLGIPLLKDLPIIGRLFSSSKSLENKAETVVFITPYVLDTLDEVTDHTVRRKTSLEKDGLLPEEWNLGHGTIGRDYRKIDEPVDEDAVDQDGETEALEDVSSGEHPDVTEESAGDTSDDTPTDAAVDDEPEEPKEPAKLSKFIEEWDRLTDQLIVTE